MKLNDTVAFLVLVAVPGAFIAADDATPMLSLVEAVCIDYDASGDMQDGTYTRCHRDYAYEQYEIQNISMGFGGFSQTTNQHSITIGPTIYVIDLSTNTGTKMTNPMYDQIVNAIRRGDLACYQVGGWRRVRWSSVLRSIERQRIHVGKHARRSVEETGEQVDAPGGVIHR